MSYEYSRIPLKSGLNIVCGPNGAGKSSILLAISVALGQVYTERSKKLSDLIRWGADTARISLVFDNRPNSMTRPIPNFDVDFLRISRYLNRNGTYWFEVNFETVNKSEVTEILKGFGINPDNMLIIMHQHMMTEFGVTTPQKKLLMVEEAVGLGEYRRHVFEAQNKLNQALSEEESVSTLLKNAEQTLDYWKNEYERFQQKKELVLKKNFLERELIWSQITHQERIVEIGKEKLHVKEKALLNKEEELEANKLAITDLTKHLDSIHHQQNELYQSLLSSEKTKFNVEDTLTNLTQTMEHLSKHETTLEEAIQHTQIMEMANKDKFSELSKSEFEKLFNQHQSYEKNLNEFQTKIQLLKQEAGGFEKEEKLLQRLMKEKKVNEEVLQKDRKRLNHLKKLHAQINPLFEPLEQVREQLTEEEIRLDSYVRELDALIKRTPPILELSLLDDPITSIQTVSDKLSREVTARNNVKTQLQQVETNIQSLSNEEQQALTAIQLCTKKIEDLTVQCNDIQSCMGGKSTSPQIQCDKCGSLLTSKQWMNRLNEINDEKTVEETRLTRLQSNLHQVRENLLTEKKELDTLTQEERMLETIRPLSIQAKQLLNDIKSSQETFQKHITEQDHIIKSLTTLMEVDESLPTLYQLVHKKATDVETEIHILELETRRIEKELSNFDELHITTQRDRVNKAFQASEKYRFLLPKMMETLKLYKTDTQSQIKLTKQKLLELEEKTSIIKAKLEEIREQTKELNDSYQDHRAKKALLAFQKENILKEIRALKSECEINQREMIQLQQLTVDLGNRIETEREPLDVSADIKIVDAHLTLLKDVSEDVEQMYISYLNIYKELKEKTVLVSENRERAITEVNERKKVWKNLIHSLLDEVNPTFRAFLEKIDATGWVTLIDPEDIEMAGLELTVGFKGAQPHVLDSRTHSGGEKSSTTMAFLLALQRHVKSPFRAVDEFDVHMDPRNREIIAQMLLLEMEQELENQYMTITPGQLYSVREDTHIITVQRIEGRSEVKILTEASLIK